MRYKTENDILAIKEDDYGFGFRIIFNIPPEEMRKRKEEIIHRILEEWKFNWNIELDKEWSNPYQCKDMNGFWSYFVTLE